MNVNNFTVVNNRNRSKYKLVNNKQQHQSILTTNQNRSTSTTNRNRSTVATTNQSRRGPSMASGVNHVIRKKPIKSLYKIDKFSGTTKSNYGSLNKLRNHNSANISTKIVSKYKIRKLSASSIDALSLSRGSRPSVKTGKFILTRDRSQTRSTEKIRSNEDETGSIGGLKNSEISPKYVKIPQRSCKFGNSRNFINSGSYRYANFKLINNRSPYTYVKKNLDSEKLFVKKRAGQALRRSFRILSSSSAARSKGFGGAAGHVTKSDTVVTNMLCTQFLRYGVCPRGNLCKFAHDRSKVAICTKFLRFGHCDSSVCKLAHEHNKDKMPLCVFFLKGACSRTDCPYLHVKHKTGAKVCFQFQRGYCPNGAGCDKLHLERESIRKDSKKMRKNGPKLNKSTKFKRTKETTISVNSKSRDSKSKNNDDCLIKDNPAETDQKREWPSFITLSPEKSATNKASEPVDLTDIEIIPSFLNF